MNSSIRIALVTGASMAKPDPESHLLVAALARRGIAADLVPWDSAQAWASYRLVVVRTPWDYFARLEEFLHWARTTSALTDFVNPFPVIEWNSHKAYLRELAAAGIATVPTLWLARGASDAATCLRDRGWDEVVVKPAVSIGAIGALRARAADPACVRADPPNAVAAAMSGVSVEAVEQTAPRSLDELEMEAIAAVMREVKGNVSAAARRLGVSRNTLYRKLGRMS